MATRRDVLTGLAALPILPVTAGMAEAAPQSVGDWLKTYYDEAGQLDTGEALPTRFDAMQAHVARLKELATGCEDWFSSCAEIERAPLSGQEKAELHYGLFQMLIAGACAEMLDHADRLFHQTQADKSYFYWTSGRAGKEQLERYQRRRDGLAAHDA